jgi:hypothetical protein
MQFSPAGTAREKRQEAYPPYQSEDLSEGLPLENVAAAATATTTQSLLKELDTPELLTTLLTTRKIEGKDTMVDLSLAPSTEYFLFLLATVF